MIAGRSGSVRLALCVALVSGAMMAAEAAAIQWPNASKYWCRYRLPDGTEDTATVTFVDLAGNDYLRRGRMVTEYPRQGWPALDQRVTVTKPEDLPGPPFPPLFTKFELTLNDPPVIQCKSFVVWGSSTRLYYGCDNGVQQVCRQGGDPGAVRPPDIPDTP